MQIFAGVGISKVGDYESIATTTVGAGGQATVSFTSIPSTYKHLQLRIIARDVSAVNDISQCKMTINSDTSSTYTRHLFYGDQGGTYAAAYNATTGFAYTVGITQGNATANQFTATVMDFVDYQNTNKFKTVRCIYGGSTNGVQTLGLISNLWQSTTAINALSFVSISGSNFAQYTQFALYGVKG